VQLVLDSEQRELRSAVRKFLIDQSRRRRSAPRWPPSWATTRVVAAAGRRAGLLGFWCRSSTAVPGAGHVERAVVAEELGRALVPAPFLASAVLAWTPCSRATTRRRAPSCCPAGRGGADRHRGGRGGRWAVGPIRGHHGHRAGRAWVLDGTKTFVLAGMWPTCCWSTRPPRLARLVRVDSPLDNPVAGLERTTLTSLTPPGGWPGCGSPGSPPARWPAPTDGRLGPGHRPGVGGAGRRAAGRTGAGHGADR